MSTFTIRSKTGKALWEGENPQEFVTEARSAPLDADLIGEGAGEPLAEIERTEQNARRAAKL